MADASGPSGGGYDFVRDSTSPPPNPTEGDEWYQPDENDAKTYNEGSGEWEDMKISDHTQLTNVDPASHHDPVTVNAPITRNAQLLALAYSDGLTLDGSDQLAVDLGSGLAIDGNGRVYIPADYVTASELSNHASDGDAHHSKPSQTQNAGIGTSTYDIAYGSGLRMDDGWQNHIVNCVVTGTVAGSSSANEWDAEFIDVTGSVLATINEGNSSTSLTGFVSEVRWNNRDSVGPESFTASAELVDGGGHSHSI
ncbi:hypothetical protein [Haloarcula onubensis]|uniref:Uncharacterized protein n=1 Tax=Haloarcula onubensis TaxID=2950539 RepID=A0ABU2FIQ1_9EURY|nr:hypothetical protein [Halomicroarcula sp. S3CR25-11]MDS0280635.1 hypothetical protein [Halomicroarcula sp. S3CR25-11]